MELDMELKKAFADLQRKMTVTKQKLQLKDMHINQIARVKQDNENTLKEFEKLTPDTVVYESVGRSFILTEIDRTKVNLKAENKSIEEKIAILQEEKVMLNRNFTQSQENLRELIQQKKAAS